MGGGGKWHLEGVEGADHLNFVYGVSKGPFHQTTFKKGLQQIIFIDLWNDILSGASAEYEAAPC